MYMRGLIWDLPCVIRALLVFSGLELKLSIKSGHAHTTIGVAIGDELWPSRQTLREKVY